MIFSFSAIRVQAKFRRHPLQVVDLLLAEIEPPFFADLHITHDGAVNVVRKNIAGFVFYATFEVVAQFAALITQVHVSYQPIFVVDKFQVRVHVVRGTANDRVKKPVMDVAKSDRASVCKVDCLATFELHIRAVDAGDELSLGPSCDEELVIGPSVVDGCDWRVVTHLLCLDAATVRQECLECLSEYRIERLAEELGVVKAAHYSGHDHFHTEDWIGCDGCRVKVRRLGGANARDQL